VAKDGLACKAILSAAYCNPTEEGDMKKRIKEDIFTRFTTRVSSLLGHAWIFAAAVAVLLLWGLSGPLLGFSDTWQLIINTSTTIITFLMVFIIQNTQNRDNMAINIKLDAMMDKMGLSARELFEAEDRSDKKLEKKKARMQKKARKSSRRGSSAKR
jgi:low affinity Fe/Cu permease